MKTKQNDSRPPFSMAMLAMDMQDFTAAEKYFKISIEVNRLFVAMDIL